MSKHNSDLEYAAAIIRDGAMRMVAQQQARTRGDCEMPPLIPANPTTSAERTEAQSLQADLFAVMCLFERLNAGQRGNLIAYLSRLVNTEVALMISKPDSRRLLRAIP